MRKYFCGWYFRCQSDYLTLAIIPSIHRTKQSSFSTIQLITDNDSFCAQFLYSDYHHAADHISIGNNRFRRDGISWTHKHLIVPLKDP